MGICSSCAAGGTTGHAALHDPPALDHGGDEEDDASPLLGPLLRNLSGLFKEEVLKRRLSPSDRAVLAQVGRDYRAALESSGLPIAGRSHRVPLRAVDFLVGRAG